MNQEKKQAMIAAEQIGIDIAESGHCAVDPWVNIYTQWGTIKEVLGIVDAKNIASKAMEGRRSEIESGDYD